MRSPRLLLPLLLLVPACAGATERGVGLRTSVAIADSYEFDLDGSPTVEDAVYDSWETGLRVYARDDQGRYLGAIEGLIAFSSYAMADAVEFTLGGRWFVLANDWIRPYAGLHGSTIFFADFGGFNAGTQFGLRPGLGVEIPVGAGAFVDFGADYTLPLLSADTSLDNDIEVQGLAVRLGIGYDF